MLPRGVRALSAAAVRWRCPPLRPSRAARSTAELFGQPRALDALRTGLAIDAHGFHVFVSGLTGSGRSRVVQQLVEELRVDRPPAPDRVFVRNFEAPQAPRLVTLPAGEGPAFKRALREMLTELRDALRQAVASRVHRAARWRARSAADAREQRLIRTFERLARQHGCAFVEQEEDGVRVPDVRPLLDGDALTVDELRTAVDAGRLAPVRARRLLATRDRLMQRFDDVADRIRAAHHAAWREVRELDRGLAGRVVGGILDAFRRRYAHAALALFLAELRERVLADPAPWLDDDDPEADRPSFDAVLDELDALVVRTATRELRSPVVLETAPSFANLFGVIERLPDGGAHELHRIHAGSLLRADGGTLVLRANDVLAEPGVWRHLERTLEAGLLEVREFDPAAGTTAGALRPEGIPIDVKVVLVGDAGQFEQLATRDPAFAGLFKVHVAFDAELPNDAANRRRLTDFLARLGDDEGLGRFAPEGAAALCEHAARAAGRRDRLSADFAELADVAREAAFLAVREGVRTVRRAHVAAACRARVSRVDLAREHGDADLRDGYLHLRTTGRVAGEVHALTVVDTGAFSFGRVVRVTARTAAAAPRRAEVVQIDRDSELTGPYHDKGLLILQGYLAEALGRDAPLGCRATLCFEQSYDLVDGDSASCAELFALLSSLAGAPLSQAIAVTGALDQTGRVLPVGGLDEKIEAFHRACRARPRSIVQGVLIPAANARDLMLDDAVVADVRAGRFAVWTMRDVGAGLALLAGRPAREVLDAARARIERWQRLGDGRGDAG